MSFRGCGKPPLSTLNKAFADLEQNRNLYKINIITNAYLSVCDYVKTRMKPSTAT